MSSKSLFSPGLKQTWVSSAPLISKIGAGMLNGFGSSILYLQSPESTIKMSLDMMSWLVSSLMFAGILGNIIAGFLIDIYGRRPASLVCNIPGIIGGIIIYLAKDVPALIIGRILFGLSLGAYVVIGTVTVAEYCSPHNRGTLFNIKTACYNLGSIISHVIGNYVDWRILALLTSVPYILCFIITYTSPESPSWLASRQQYEKSKKSFYWLRGKNEDTTREIEELIFSQNNKKNDSNIKKKFINFMLKFKQRNFLMPTLILIIAFVLIETSGRHLFPSYGSQIVKEITSDGINMFYYKFLIDSLIFIACVITACLIRIFNCRTILFVTGIATFIVLNIACLTLFLFTKGFISSDYSLLPLILFAIFFFLGNLGCSCIPFVLIGELYPLEHRAVGTALTGNILLVMIGINLKIFPSFIAAFSTYGAFAIFGIAMAVSLFLLYFILPETKDRTLLEIEKYFCKDKIRVPTDDDEEVNVKLKNVC